MGRTLHLGLTPLDATALRLSFSFGRLPKVARSSQPWALGRNPFGILLLNANGVSSRSPGLLASCYRGKNVRSISNPTAVASKGKHPADNWTAPPCCVTKRQQLPPTNETTNDERYIRINTSAGATALRLNIFFGSLTQGSSFLATLGFEAESLWDSLLSTAF